MVRFFTAATNGVMAAPANGFCARICVAVDGNGKMQSICEATLSPAAKLTFSAEMLLGMAEEPGKHRDQFKFGYALQIGQ